MLATAWLLCVLVFALQAPANGASPRSAAQCGGADLVPAPGNAAAVQAATLCLIDMVRAQHRLQPLRANAMLRAVAHSQVQSMVRWNYFADVRPSGQTPFSLIAASRYRAHAASISTGQDIAWGTGSHATPASIVAAWMASPPHRTIILTGSYRDAGVSVMPSLPSVVGHGHGGAIYAIEFAARG